MSSRVLGGLIGESCSHFLVLVGLGVVSCRQVEHGANPVSAIGGAHLSKRRAS